MYDIYYNAYRADYSRVDNASDMVGEYCSLIDYLDAACRVFVLRPTYG